MGPARTAVQAAAAPEKVLAASAVLAAALVGARWGRSKECQEVRLVALAMRAVSWDAAEMAAAAMEPAASASAMARVAMVTAAMAMVVASAIARVAATAAAMATAAGAGTGAVAAERAAAAGGMRMPRRLQRLRPPAAPEIRRSVPDSQT